jgi:phage shock protein E
MTNFKLSMLVIGAAGIGAALVFQARAELPDEKARKHLERGALVVDVRTIGEYQSRNLAGVTNIPLADLKEKFPRAVTNKSSVVLLHCRTGRRSGIAERELRALGYTNTFNIGSFEKAERILSKPAE